MTLKFKDEVTTNGLLLLDSSILFAYLEKKYKKKEKEKSTFCSCGAQTNLSPHPKSESSLHRQAEIKGFHSFAVFGCWDFLLEMVERTHQLSI